MRSLIDALYGALLDPTRDHALPNDYFLDRTILSAKNVEVNEINSTVLASFTGKTTIYTSVDSVTEKEYEYIPTEFLHTLDPSGFPLHQLELKNGSTHATMKLGPKSWPLQWHTNDFGVIYSTCSSVSCSSVSCASKGK